MIGEFIVRESIIIYTYRREFFLYLVNILEARDAKSCTRNVYKMIKTSILRNTIMRNDIWLCKVQRNYTDS